MTAQGQPPSPADKGPTTNDQRTAEGRPEWVLLYRMGLSRTKIAELTRTDRSVIARHIASAKASDPALHAEHAVAAKGSAKHSVPGLKRLYQVLATVEATGRYPSRNSQDKTERDLAQWLRRRRRDAEAGVLNPVIREGLSALPDWQRKPREISHEQQWQDRLEELIAYRAAGHPWPRTTSDTTGQEKHLGMWLRSQRFNHRRGQLSPARAQTLESSLPSWTTGRKTSPVQSKQTE